MDKKNTKLIIIIIFLVIIVICMAGYIARNELNEETADEEIINIKDEENINDTEEIINIKKDDSLEYVYDATYTYDNKYTEYELPYGTDELTITNENGFGIRVPGKKQYISNLLVPYINIDTDDADNVNKELEGLYIEYAKQFDECAKEAENRDLSCTVLLNYRTYIYNNILSIVVIEYVHSSSQPASQYCTYSFDLENGNRLTFEEVANKLNYDEDTLLSNMETLLKEKMDLLYSNADDLSTGCIDGSNCYEIANSILESSMEDGSILFFVNYKGNLNILTIAYYTGVQNGDIRYRLIELE